MIQLPENDIRNIFRRYFINIYVQHQKKKDFIIIIFHQMNKKFRSQRQTSQGRPQIKKFNYENLLKEKSKNFVQTYFQRLKKSENINKKNFQNSTIEGYAGKQSMKAFMKTFQNNQNSTKRRLNMNTNRSQSSSRIIDLRKHQKQIYQQIEQSPPPQEVIEQPKYSFLELQEKRVEELIKIKLFKKFQNRTLLSTRIRQDQIEKELQQIIQSLRQYETTIDLSNVDKQIATDLQQIDRKIALFEKIIAQSFSQVEMLKKYYHTKRSLNTRAHPQINTKLHMSCENLGKISNKNHFFGRTSHLNMKTVNQVSFLKPRRTDYEQKSKGKQNVYTHNRQNLPISSYQKQFLNYGALPIYNHRQSDTYLSSVSENKMTTYQTDFYGKSVPPFDSKTTDCRKDKIKPGKIPFMGKQYSTAPQNLKLVFKERNNINGSRLQKDSVETKNVIEKSDNRLLNKTEFQCEYQGEKLTLSNFIKDKNLSNLKNRFKNQIFN